MAWGLTLVKTNCSTNEVSEFIALKWPGLQDEETDKWRNFQN